MCGITGIVNLDGQPVEQHELLAMNEVVRHRGPDGDGIFCRGNVGLAHRRLAIIDPRAGIQPFYNDDQSVIISYNGEVYNYVELSPLLKSDFNIRTQSDTEIVMRAYEKWGIECLEYFRGMFAFAIYDDNSKMLYIVRDRVGIKPLFYYHTSQRLLFASEIMPILQASDVKREILPESLSSFFRYQYVPTPATIYKNFYKLEPGHYLAVNTRTGVVHKHQYWNLNVDIIDRAEDDWLEELNALLSDTVRIYVRSDVPFGAFLSGGVDSSIVIALMDQHLAEPVRTFTIGFQEEKHSEISYAAQASRIIGTNHYERIVSPRLAEDILSVIVRHFGEPFADSSAIPTYYVSRESARQVKMVLSGDGGDELFGGYNSYPITFREYESVSYRLSNFVANIFARYGFTSMVRAWAQERLLLPYRLSYDAQRQIFTSGQLRRLMVPGHAIAPPVQAVFDTATSGLDPVTRFQAQDFKTYLVDDVLTKVDRMSMANSLEVRVPLLDHKVVELAFALPLALKLRRENNHIQTKYLLKRSATRFYTDDFLNRPKQGFGIPIVEWGHGALKPLVEARLRRKANPIYDWIQYPYVQSILDGFYQGKNDNLITPIWFVLMFDLWMEHVHQAT